MKNFNLKAKIKKLLKQHKYTELYKLSYELKLDNDEIFVTIASEQAAQKTNLEIQQALTKLLQENYPDQKVKILIHHHKTEVKKPKLVLVCSAKGGVGKSTIAVNLALSLKEQKYKVGLVDADIYGPSVNFLLGNQQIEPKIKDNLMQPLIAHGLQYNSMGALMPEEQALIWRGPMISKALSNLINNTAWSDLDYLIIDMPPGTGDIYITLLKNYDIHGAIMISSAQQISLLDVGRSVDMLKKMQINILGIIENLSLLASKNVTKFAAKEEIPYLGKLSIHEDIARSADENMPFILTKNKAQQELTLITKNLIKKWN